MIVLILLEWALFISRVECKNKVYLKFLPNLLFRIFSQRTNRLSLEFEFDPGLTSTNTAKILFHPTDPFAFAFDKTRVDTPLQFYLPEFADLTAP